MAAPVSIGRGRLAQAAATDADQLLAELADCDEAQALPRVQTFFRDRVFSLLRFVETIPRSQDDLTRAMSWPSCLSAPLVVDLFKASVIRERLRESLNAGSSVADVDAWIEARTRPLVLLKRHLSPDGQPRFGTPRRCCELADPESCRFAPAPCPAGLLRSSFRSIRRRGSACPLGAGRFEARL